MEMPVRLAGSSGQANGLQPLGAQIDVMGERVADDLRLFMDFLGHEMAVIALLGEQAAGRRLDVAALDDLVVDVAELGAGARQRSPSRPLRDRRRDR